MYKYEFAKKYQDRLEYYDYYGSNNHVTWKSYLEMKAQGWPQNYNSWHVLNKAVNFVFYSKNKLEYLYVEGMQVPKHFFTETFIKD